MQIVDIEVETLSAVAFAPYGWLLAAGDTPDFERPGLQNWRLPYESDAVMRLQVMRYSKQQRQLSLFERHTKVTEARSPIGDATAILVVAGGTELESTPELSSVRAFYMDGSQGIMFRKGIWHGLDCFPVHHRYVDFLFLSDAATEDEIEASKDPRHGIRTELFDFADQDTAFRITDTKGIMTA